MRMNEFDMITHKQALLRRRIKFVTEKGSMARLFRAGMNSNLQMRLYERLQPTDIIVNETIGEYDTWLIGTVELPIWAPFVREDDDIESVRWGYFAKLINVLVYEILSNRELVLEKHWFRLKSIIHLPIDKNVTQNILIINPEFKVIQRLKGMTKQQYLNFQADAKKLADIYNVPKIWLEDAWA